MTHETVGKWRESEEEKKWYKEQNQWVVDKMKIKDKTDYYLALGVGVHNLLETYFNRRGTE